MQKKVCSVLLAVLLLLLCGCTGSKTAETVDILATTAPVHEMVCALTEGTGLQVGRMITESVSCLHDYTLTVSQMQMLEGAEVVVISGLGLEDFMADALQSCDTIVTASEGIVTHEGDEGADPHIWLDPIRCKQMAENICAGLCAAFPEHAAAFEDNLGTLNVEYDAVQAYGEAQLQNLTCRELVTFHDGFGYFAEAFDLTVAAAMEVEHGSEPSARELEEVISIVENASIPAIFDEENGEHGAAETVAGETGAALFTLDMGMCEEVRGCGETIRKNIDMIKEALG